MKLKEGFVLRQVAGSWVVLPVGQMTVNFNGMLTLNDSGALLWKTLSNGGSRDDLADALQREYEVDHSVALADADEFLAELTKAGCLE